MLPHLTLRFLGLPQLQLNDQPVSTDRRKAIALLAYLAVNDLERGFQKYSREVLSALLWPEYEQANLDKIIVACLARLGDAAFSNAYE